MVRSYWRLSSETAMSIGGLGSLAACPQLEHEPHIHCMAEHKSEKVIQLCSQDMVEL